MQAQFFEGNALRLLNSGAEYFPALLKALAEARREVYLESYIFADDPSGRAVAQALCRAAERGVQVHVLVDGFGGGDFPRQTLPVLAASGVKTMIFRPELGGVFERLRFKRHRLRRLHRKIVVVDAKIAFVGGINVIDDLNTPHQVPPRYDYAVQVEGPLLKVIHDSVRELWGVLVWANFKRRYRVQEHPPVTVTPLGEQRAAFVVRDNLRHRRDIEEAYLEAIGNAREEILLANAYFLPGWRFRQALRQAAQRGVKVTVLLQGRVEYRLLHYASQALYGSLLDAGVRIFEYHRSFLHAKVAVIDHHWATVGSSNIDPFSLLLAREGNVVVQDNGFAAILRESLLNSMQEGSAELLPGHWRQLPWYQRVLRWSSYNLVRLMIGLAGYGREH